MLLTHYVRNKFFTYFLLTNSILVLLYALIEFFEKLTRVHTAFFTIVLFITERFIVIFFDLFPLSTCIAGALLAREFSRNATYEGIAIIGISLRRLIAALAMVGALLSISSFIGKEFIAHRAHLASTDIRSKEFKKQTGDVLEHIWLRPTLNTIMHLRSLHITSCDVSDILIIELDNKKGILKQWHALEGKLDSTTQSLCLFNVKYYDRTSGCDSTLATFSYHAPALCSYLTEQHTPLCWYDVLIHRKLPQTKQWFLLLTNFLCHLQSFFYVLLSALLFIIFLAHPVIRWLATLAVYPLFMVSTSFIDFLTQHGVPSIIMIIPYCIATIACIFLYYSIT